MADKRDDRFVAAFNVGLAFRPRNVVAAPAQFHIAYVARAVTPGRFVLPAAMVEDMYAPAITARTAIGTLSVCAMIVHHNTETHASPRVRSTQGRRCPRNVGSALARVASEEGGGG